MPLLVLLSPCTLVPPLFPIFQREMEKAVTFNAAAVVNKSAVVSFSESSQQQSKAHMMRIGGGGPEARGEDTPLLMLSDMIGNYRSETRETLGEI